MDSRSNLLRVSSAHHRPEAATSSGRNEIRYPTSAGSYSQRVMQRWATGQPKQRPYKLQKQNRAECPSPGQKPPSKMALERGESRPQAHPVHRERQPNGTSRSKTETLFFSVIRGPGRRGTGRVFITAPSPETSRGTHEPADSPVSSTNRNMADLMYSQSSPDRDLPAPQPTPYAGDAVLLARFSAMLQQELKPVP